MIKELKELDENVLIQRIGTYTTMIEDIQKNIVALWEKYFAEAKTHLITEARQGNYFVDQIGIYTHDIFDNLKSHKLVADLARVNEQLFPLLQELRRRDKGKAYHALRKSKVCKLPKGRTPKYRYDEFPLLPIEHINDDTFVYQLKPYLGAQTTTAIRKYIIQQTKEEPKYPDLLPFYKAYSQGDILCKQCKGLGDGGLLKLKELLVMCGDLKA